MLSYEESLPKIKYFIICWNKLYNDAKYEPELYKGICEINFKKRSLGLSEKLETVEDPGQNFLTEQSQVTCQCCHEKNGNYWIIN